jgi:hypothetical protein
MSEPVVAGSTTEIIFKEIHNGCAEKPQDPVNARYAAFS